MTGFKLFSPVGLSLALTVFAPTISGFDGAEALRGPVTPSVASFQPSFDSRSDLGTPMSATTTGCRTAGSGVAVVTADIGASSKNDPQRAGSEGPSSTEQPLPDACPDDDDTLFWDEVYLQIAERCGNDPEDDNTILEIECDAIGGGDVYRFRARVRCASAT